MYEYLNALLLLLLYADSYCLDRLANTRASRNAGAIFCKDEIAILAGDVLIRNTSGFEGGMDETPMIELRFRVQGLEKVS